MTVNIVFIHTIMIKNLIVFLLRQNIQFYTHSTKSTRRTRKRKQKTVYNNASELYNQYLKIYFNQ